MTVSSTTNIKRFTGNGSSVEFTYDKKIFTESTLQIILRDTSTTPDTLTTAVLNGSGTYDYTLSIAADFNSATITFNTAPISTHKITAERILPVTQEDDLTEADDLPADTLETIQDKQLLMIQQIADSIDRAIKFASSVADAGVLEVSDEVADRASKFLQFNSLGDLTLNDLSALSASEGVDETDTDITKNKLVSNNLMKVLEDYRTLLTTKGDLLGFSTLAARLAIGANGGYLTPDSTEALGMKWAPLPDRLNRIINGGFSIAQRGTSFVSPINGAFTLDRWAYTKIGSGVVTITQDTDTPNGNIPFSLKVDVTTAEAGTAGNFYALRQRIEGYMVEDMGFGTAQAKQITLSFWVKSPKTGEHVVQFVNAATNRSYPATYSVLSADTWEQKTVTLTADTTGTWVKDNGVGLQLLWGLEAGSDYDDTGDTWAAPGSVNFASTSAAVNCMDNTANNFFLADVSLVAGSAAIPAARRTYYQELELCRRYFERRSGDNEELGMGAGTSTTSVVGAFRYFTTKRAAPTLTFSDGAAVDFQNSAPHISSAVSASRIHNDSARLTLTVSSVNVADAGDIILNGSTKWVEIDAEL